jgi:RluA family pseudouridine synthase
MIPILYQDGDCVAVLKPCGVAAVPEQAGDTACLSARLGLQLGVRVFPVHRLDKDVSGVILYALTADAHRALNRAFEQRRVHKTYLAVVRGIVQADEGVIRHPLREFGSGRMGVDEVKGKPSETQFKVLQRRQAFSLVQLHPLTGRRHQLRVHLYSVGHPIAGDKRYGSPELRQDFPRLMLTSAGIALALPSGNTLELSGVIPADFVEAARICFSLIL